MDLTPLPFWGGETGGNDDSGIAVHTIAGIYDLINPVTKLVIPAVAESRNPEKALRLLESRIRENDGMMDISCSI